MPNCLGGGTVVLRNTGGTPVTFTVLVDGAAIATPTVQPGRTTTLPVDVPEDGSVDVVVTVGGTTILDDTITRDCDEPTPPGSPDVSAAFSCVAGGTIVLDNSTSKVDRVFDITIGDVMEVLVVPAGQVETVSFDVPDGTTSTVTVQSDGETLLTESFPADCTSVLGVDIERDDPLPAPQPAADPAPEVGPTTIGNLPSTGSDAARLLLLAVVLIGVGVPVTHQTRLGRRPR